MTTDRKTHKVMVSNEDCDTIIEALKTIEREVARGAAAAADADLPHEDVKILILEAVRIHELIDTFEKAKD